MRVKERQEFQDAMAELEPVMAVKEPKEKRNPRSKRFLALPHAQLKHQNVGDLVRRVQRKVDERGRVGAQKFG